MNNLPDERGGCRRVLVLCRFGVLSLALILIGLMPLRAAEAPEPLTPCTAEPTDMNIDYGTIVDCVIETSGDSDIFRFSGKANTVVVVALTDPTLPAPGWGCQTCKPTVAYVYAPGSTTPLRTVSMGGQGLDGGAAEITLPIDGAYVIKVADNPRKYRLLLDRLLPASPTAKPVAFGVSTGMVGINPTPDQDFYTFAAYKDATINLTFSNSDLVLRLFGPDQKLIDNVGRKLTTKDITLPLDGTYTVRIFDYYNKQVIGYNITLQCLFPPTGQTSCGPLKSAVTVDLSSNLNPAPLGQPITFTGAVRNAKNPTGKLNFSVDGSAIAPCTDMSLNNASANCTASGLTVGNHAIMARYSGDSTNNSAQATLTQVVQAPPPNSHPLKVTRAPTGIVTSEPAGINCGAKNKLCTGAFSQVTLTAAPVPGYGFKQWVGCPQPTGNTCTMTLTQATKIKASFFKLPKYALKLTKSRLGKVTSSPPGLLCNVAKTRTCRGVFTSGTTVTLTAEPLPGFAFIGWSGACSENAKTCTLIMDGKKSVGATFQ